MVSVNIAKLLLLLFGTYLTGLSLLPRHQRPAGVAEAILYFVLGLVLVTALYLLSKIAHLPWYSTLIAIVAMSIKPLWRRQYRIEGTEKYHKGELLGASILALTAMLPILIMGFYMAVNAYPQVFFAVDSPYFLHHVYALMYTSEYPPPSFELHGYSWKYHYGVQSLVALTSLVSGIKPHTVMFGIIVPLLQFLTFFLAYLLVAEVIQKGYARYIVFGILLIGAKHHILDYLDVNIVRHIVQVERFNFRYAHPPSVMGMVMVLATIYCVLNYQTRRTKIVATILVGLMPIVKIPYAFFAGAGYAAFLTAEYVRLRDISLMVHLLAAGALCVVSYFVFSAMPYGAQGIAEFDVLGFLDMMDQSQIVTLSVYAALTLGLFPFMGGLRTTHQVRSLGLFVLGIFVLFSVLELESQNSAQVFDPAIVPAVLLLVSIGFASCGEGQKDRRYCKGYAGALLIAMVPGLVSLIGHTYLLLTDPAKGHEYASNESLGEVLSEIPTRGALIVTNDLRYPAENYKREGRQLQFAGILGHRNVATNFEYKEVSEAEEVALLKLRERIDRLVSGDRWSMEDAEALRREYPITHLVIHKAYPHPKDIPLEKVYENEDYVAYSF